MSSFIKRTKTIGGSGGSSFDDSSAYINNKARISQIEIRSGRVIDAISIVYTNGKTLRHGGNGGGKHIIQLADGEFITRVSGRSGRLVDQLTFYSSTGKTYGPYGGSGGSAFSFSFTSLSLLYIFGRSGALIDSIGFAYGPLPDRLTAKIDKLGSYGGQGGSDFDDMSNVATQESRIRSIKVRHGARVDAIQVMYNNEWSPRRGGTGGRESQFDLALDEYLVKVTGRSGSSIDRIQFYTSKGRVSPAYGGSGGSSFTLHKEGYAIHAFYGRSGANVDQIGAYVSNGVVDRVEMTAIEYDLGSLNTVRGTPQVVVSAILRNDTSVAQQVLQSQSSSKTVSTTVSSSFSFSQTVTISYSSEFTAGVVKQTSGVSIGFGFEQSFSKSETVSETVTEEHRFTTVVPPYSSVEATGTAMKQTLDVPWTATATIYYLGKDEPEVTTISGIYNNVDMTTLDVTYKTLGS